MEIPEFIIHYSRAEPFRSISSLSKERQVAVLNELDEATAWGLGRFSDPEYLERRLVVERRLRNEFMAKGGKPKLDHPIYFFLGRNLRFESHKSNKVYQIRLNDLSKDVVSFTYGDSLFSFNEDYRSLKGGGYLSELCPNVYGVGDLPDLFSHPDFQSIERLHVEAQLWITPSHGLLS